MPSTKTILFNEALPDIAVSQYGDIGSMFAIALQNGIGITDDLVAGVVLVLPDYDTTKMVLSGSETTEEKKTVLTVTPIPMQTLSDIAIQETGTMDNFFTLALLNGIGITDDLEAGVQLISLKPSIDKVATVRALQARKPASAGMIEEQGGIGYMQISTTFNVS